MNTYLRIRSPEKARRLVEELQADGIAPERIRIHATRPPDLPVTRIRFLTPAQALGQGALFGGAALLAIAFLLVAAGYTGALGMVLLPALGATVGAAWAQQRNDAMNRSVEPQLAALERGELLMVLALGDSEVGRIEQRITTRHPEVSVLGTDAAGTPPFP
ncbi:hypothetical protein Thimo_1401 [Thioflavicoccus mobilis 8321]|uniref:DUF1269 domain-containing protein n=1 Tax=Thioflavicoccus mobilis 8321 TaxID=765912 RepID=L0GXU1_9GAMM|nr:hypothetical protein [Thioflavicoccus mobilis]AGA90195.1 hypothetical protein Thimo_1401 [Thioflavicoccus mobilis 8321]